MNNILGIFQTVVHARIDNAMVDHIGMVLHKPAQKGQKAKMICIDYLGGPELLHYNDREPPAHRGVLMPVCDVLFERVTRVAGVLQALDKKDAFPFYFSRDMEPSEKNIPWGAQSVTLDGRLNQDYNVAELEEGHLQLNARVDPLRARARVNCHTMTEFVLKMSGLVSQKHVDVLYNALTGTAVKNRIETKFWKFSRDHSQFYGDANYTWNHTSDAFQSYVKAPGKGLAGNTIIKNMVHVPDNHYGTLWDRMQNAKPAPIVVEDPKYIEWPNYIAARLKKHGMAQACGLKIAA